MGVYVRKPKREIRWSPELAYAVGLIATDGCLSGDHRHFSVVSKDVEQLQNLKQCLGLKVKIGTHKSGRKDAKRTYHRVQWGDVALYDFLLGIGLTPHKSKTLSALEIPDEYFFDFLRGHHDGDGSFYSYYDPRWRSSFMFYLQFVSASPVHIDWIRSGLERLLSIRGHVSIAKQSDIVQLRYAKTESVELLKRLYSRPGAKCLTRKRLKIERALRIVGESLPKAS